MWVLKWWSDIARSAIVGYTSREGLLLGTFIAMYAAFTQVDTMGIDLRSFDDTPADQKWRVQCWRDGRRIKSRLWLDVSGARQIPPKSIIRSRYRITMYEYWWTLDPQKRERAERMSKYVKSPDPDEGALHFPENVERRARPSGRRPD